ncbi:MAG: hypothetical protein P8X51_14850 [Maritimibacter sp.]
MAKGRHGAGRGEAVLLGLWTGAGAVHMALHVPGTRHVGLVSLDMQDRFPSVGQFHAAAQRRNERSTIYTG